MSQDLAVTSERDLTLDLTTFFSNLTFEELSFDVVQHAKLSILNSIGCGLSAAPLECHSKMCSTLDIASKQVYGGELNAATILARHERASMEDAAMLNGLAMTARFFDDTHLSTVVHPSGPPLAASLAYAEAHHCSGQDVLLAFVVGVETMLAVATALGMDPYRRGWHTTSLTGSFGAASAISKMMHLPPIQFAHALGHASSMAAGTRGVFGTDSLSMHAGRAAQSGILAARMAKEGLTSTTHALEKWIKLISPGRGDSTAIPALADATSASGRQWKILENAFKPYPCGIVSHPAIDAGVAAHEYLSPEAHIAVPLSALNTVFSIEARVTPLTLKLCGIRHPVTASSTIFSTHHGIAVGLIYGKAGIHEYSMSVANDPLVKEMRDRVRLTADETLRDDQASLTVGHREATGAEVENTFAVEHATGSLQNPMSEQQLEEKFADQAKVGHIDGKAVQRALKGLRNLESVEDMAGVMKYFVPPSVGLEWLTEIRQQVNDDNR